MRSAAKSLFAALVCGVTLGACAANGRLRSAAESEPLDPAFGRVVEAPINDASGQRIGDARFTEGASGVLIRVDIRPGALAPGWHGLHIHEIGTCEDVAAGFKASGSHVGHSATGEHGLLNPTGPEAGDLPNLHAPMGGAIAAEFYSSMLTLSDRGQGRLPMLDTDGAALIIHANQDDHTSQPIGGAGARVACAALRP